MDSSEENTRDDRKAFLLWPEPGTKLGKTYYIQIVDKDIAHDYSQVKCTFVDPSIPPEDANVHELSAEPKSINELPEAKATTEEGDIVVTCINGNDEPGLYMYQLVMKMGTRESFTENSRQLAERMVQNCLKLADENHLKSVAFCPFETKGRNGDLKISQLLLECFIQFVDEMDHIKVFRIMSRNKKTSPTTEETHREDNELN